MKTQDEDSRSSEDSTKSSSNSDKDQMGKTQEVPLETWRYKAICRALDEHVQAPDLRGRLDVLKAWAEEECYAPEALLRHARNLELAIKREAIKKQELRVKGAEATYIRLSKVMEESEIENRRKRAKTDEKGEQGEGRKTAIEHALDEISEESLKLEMMKNGEFAVDDLLGEARALTQKLSQQHPSQIGEPAEAFNYDGLFEMPSNLRPDAKAAVEAVKQLLDRPATLQEAHKAKNALYNTVMEERELRAVLSPSVAGRTQRTPKGMIDSVPWGIHEPFKQLHEEFKLATTLESSIATDFCFVPPWDEAEFVTELAARIDHRSDITARREAVLNGSTRADIIVDSESSPCAVIKVKRDASASSISAATRQVLEYAGIMIKKQGTHTLRGRMWPIAITVCGHRVDVSVCVLAAEAETSPGKEQPVVARVELGTVPLVQLGQVLTFARKHTLQSVKETQSIDLAVLRAGKVFRIGSRVVKVLETGSESLRNELIGWACVHGELELERVEDEEGGCTALSLPLISSPAGEEAVWEDLWSLARRGLVHLDVRNDNVVCNRLIDFEHLQKPETTYPALNTWLPDRPPRIFGHPALGHLLVRASDPWTARLRGRTPKGFLLKKRRELQQQHQRQKEQEEDGVLPTKDLLHVVDEALLDLGVPPPKEH